MAANKRTTDQIVRDRARISQLMLQRYTHEQMRILLHDETGVELSRVQITGDVKAVRNSWRKVQHENYTALMARELSRIDSLETVLWEEMRAEADRGADKQIIEEVRRIIKDTEESKLVVNKVTKMVQNTYINPKYVAQIIECQKERRRLLGLYAPTQIGIHKEVVIKAYTNISPNDWPDAIEGEIVND